MWYYGHPEARNFGGINFSLDNYNGVLNKPRQKYFHKLIKEELRDIFENDYEILYFKAESLYELQEYADAEETYQKIFFLI